MSVEHRPQPEAAGVTSEEAAVARIVTRLSAEYVLGAFQLLIDAHGDIRSGLLVEAINAANVRHLDARTEAGRRARRADGVLPDDVRRPISVARLSESTGLPFESTRRIVQRLIEAGVCVRVEGGVIVPRAIVEGPDAVRLVAANVQYVREFVRKLLAFGLVEEAAPAEAGAWQADVADAAVGRVVARLSAEYLLRALRLLAETYGDIRLGVVAQTIVAANTAHLEAPMGEGWRYSGIDQSPPDAARRPISVLSLARLLGLPYETARQQVRRLIEGGVCVRVEGGLIVPMAVLDSPAAARAMLANVRYVRKFARDLQAIGFDTRGP
jgi:DNA-binding Lrp family transcriptional regulator